MKKLLVRTLATGLLVLSVRAEAQGTKLMIFGGDNHKTYLGCLNCSQYDSDSVHNKYGDHGSQYASDSVFNPYGEYGSQYSNESACNPYANDPPVIVDGNGGFYGRLTLNLYHPQATKNQALQGWLTGVCEHN
jgi:hypothetical protein